MQFVAIGLLGFYTGFVFAWLARDLRRSLLLTVGWLLLLAGYLYFASQ